MPARQHRTIVFAGAGASQGVSPEKYPTTIGFFKQLEESTTNDTLYDELLRFVQRGKGQGATIGVEELLWHLGELRAFFERGTNQETFPGWFLGRDLATILRRNGESIGHFTKLGQAAISRAKTLSESIHEHVYSLYKQEPEPAELDATWIPLLRGLSAAGRVDVVTTNYDLVLESAIDVGGISSIETGWGREQTRVLDLSRWSDANRTTGLLTKLHGSVDWVWDDERILKCAPVFKGEHRMHPILYPGFKGKPESSPFRELHDYFGRALQGCTAVVFVGFAFRDEHINDLCERYLPRTAKVVVVDLDERRPPFRNDARCIPGGFGRAAVEDVLGELGQGAAA